MNERQRLQDDEYKTRIKLQEAKLKANPPNYRENLVFKTRTPVVDSSYKPNLKLEAAIYSAVQQIKE